MLTKSWWHLISKQRLTSRFPKTPSDFFNLTDIHNSQVSIMKTNIRTSESLHSNRTHQQQFWPGLCSSAMVRAQALPNTTRSSRELAPSRLAPWTLAHAASPQAYSPRTTLSFPSAWVITWYKKNKHEKLCHFAGMDAHSEALKWGGNVGRHKRLHVTHLTLEVCWYSTHIIMDCGQDGDGLLRDVDSSKDHSRLWDTWKPCGQLLWRQVVKLQVHVVLLWTNTPERIKTGNKISDISSLLSCFKTKTKWWFKCP